MGRADFYKYPRSTTWKCLCDCQQDLPESARKYTYCTTGELNSGHIKSCGCLQRSAVRKINAEKRKINKYDLTGDYGIGWDAKGVRFIFDLEDYDLLKEFSWYFATRGYLCTVANQQNSYLVKNNTHRLIYMHKLILGLVGTNVLVDHINGLTWDNRKQNLRIVTKHENAVNCKIPSNNTSGHKGVCFCKDARKWRASINCNNKTINLGYFDNYDDAVIAREEAEDKYFGEYNRAKEFIHNGVLS